MNKLLNTLWKTSVLTIVTGGTTGTRSMSAYPNTEIIIRKVRFDHYVEENAVGKRIPANSWVECICGMNSTPFSSPWYNDYFNTYTTGATNNATIVNIFPIPQELTDLDFRISPGEQLVFSFQWNFYQTMAYDLNCYGIADIYFEQAQSITWGTQRRLK